MTIPFLVTAFVLVSVVLLIVTYKAVAEALDSTLALLISPAVLAAIYSISYLTVYLVGLTQNSTTQEFMRLMMQRMGGG